MDSEEYYDSLDEDSNYGSFESLEEPTTELKPKGTRTCSKIPVKIKKRQRRPKSDLSLKTEDDAIPFYDQSLSKSEVEMKKTFLKYGCDREESKKKSKKKLSKKISYTSVSGRFKSNSYLDMFYARIGGDASTLTNRATCTDLSPKSYVTCEDLDLVSMINFSDSESVYSSNEAKYELSLSSSSLDSKFCSASQISQFNFHIMRPSNAYPKRSGVQVPMLGSLGPDIPKDKLECFKKRLDYGRKATQKNKIKMMERKVLQNLQKEIAECKNV